MKKLIKALRIIIINVIILVIIDFLFFLYFIASSQQMPNNIKDIVERYKSSSNIIPLEKVCKEKESSNYFRDFIKKSEKQPILIFGCSFGYGFLLEPEQSFSYKLSQYTNRSIYNRSISSLGIQYFPYILEHYNLENTIKDPQYIIFVMIDNHAYRLYREIMNVDEPYLDILYENKEGSLQERNVWYWFIFKSAILREINLQLVNYLYKNRNHDEVFDFIKAHFLKAKEIINKKFPNSKIVILKYEENENSWIFNSPRWQELSQNGFIVLDTYDLTGLHLYENKYRIPNDPHPNELAWDLLTPKIVEKLGLKEEK